MLPSNCNRHRSRQKSALAVVLSANHTSYLCVVVLCALCTSILMLTNCLLVPQNYLFHLTYRKKKIKKLLQRHQKVIFISSKYACDNAEKNQNYLVSSFYHPHQSIKCRIFLSFIVLPVNYSSSFLIIHRPSFYPLYYLPSLLTSYITIPYFSPSLRHSLFFTIPFRHLAITFHSHTRRYHHIR